MPTESKRTELVPPIKADAPAKKPDIGKADEPLPEEASGNSSRRLQSEPGITIDRVEVGQNAKELFPVVGIGASAGGLEAFTQLLKNLPADTGMAFVLVQHLDPNHESLLTELLARATRMPVREVTEGTYVEPDHVYVIPPNTNMAIVGSVLQLQSRQNTSGQHLPIDFFLRSLAEDRSSRAIGVILSGTASDGTLGLEAIKTEGGIAFAQDPKSAKYDSMPRSAVESGCVDFVLTPENIAKEIARISRHPYVASGAVAEVARPVAQSVEAKVLPEGADGFDQILILLQKTTGVDFRLYKSNTLHRRIMRRAVLNKMEGLEDYARYLGDNDSEVTSLYQDILINVTKFFRHPETFVVLKEKIFPRMIERRTSDEPVRIWVLGCSTGEEAYSIAIAFTEFAGERSDYLPIQIFATDLNETGIVKARAGLFSKNITHDVSPERLRRFFTEADGGYQISKPIRDMCVFARQNIIADPPFSQMDLISCRNLLIYLDPVLQKQVMPLLHYALKPTGFLWLGSSETTGSSANLFMPEDRKHRFYSRKPASARHVFSFPSRNHMQNEIDSVPKTASVAIKSANGGYDVRREADQFMLERYAPASIVINEEMEVLQLRGDTAPYLEQSLGKPTRNLLQLAREGLLVELRASIHKAQQDESSIIKKNLRIKYDGEFRDVNLEVIPLNHHPAQKHHFLILFETAAAPETDETGGCKQKAEGSRQKPEEHQVTRLKQELAAARAHLQSLIEEHEAAIEELQSASEEVQSSNEEFQSINEELETAKEELESSNEELTTLNQELENRNLELGWLNSDLTNLLDSVQMPILMLDNGLRIRRFTPTAADTLNLISTDVGRSIGDIKPNINVPDLEQLIEEAIKTASVLEREVQDTEGRWFSLHVRPYKTLDNKIDGAVLVLVDIDALKRSETQIRESRDYAASIIATVREPLVILDGDLRVQMAGRCFYETFKVTPEETENRFIYDAGNGQWNIPELRTLLEDILPAQNHFEDFEVEHEFERIGRKVMLLSASEIRQDVYQRRLILFTIKDITKRKLAEEELEKSTHQVTNILESITSAFYALDTEWRLTYINEHAEQVLGKSRHALLGKVIWDEFPEAVDTAFYTQFKRAVAEGVTVKVEDFYAPFNKWFEVHAYPSQQGLAVYIDDITERKRAQAQVRTSELRYRRLFETARDGILILDNVARKITDANPYMTELLGYPRDDLLGKELWEIGLMKDAESSIDAFQELLERGYIRYEDLPLQTKDGKHWNVEFISNLYAENGHQVIQCNIRDITERKAAESRIAHEAFHDALTGLPNRKLFIEHLHQAIAHTERHAEYMYAVLFLDLDRFKFVNDTLGHVIGDQFLGAIARKLEAIVRPEDIVARLGGDEFTILLSDIGHISDTTRVANRINHELSLPFKLGGHDVFTTASIGIALSLYGYSETEEVLRDADTAMYRAKSLGGGRYEIFDASMHASVMTSLKLEADLRLAVAREELRLYYQPIVALEDNRIVGFEALVRWQHPERGLVLPDEFIPIAEETGLIMAIGHWVLNESCRQLRQWQDDFHGDLSMSVNVNLSCKEFSQANFSKQVGSILEQTGVSAGSLKLEITESTVMEEAEAATAMLGQLKDLGVKLHIDDFGTGYSSLSNLHYFHVDGLKIDRSFVGRMGPGAENSEIVQTIIQLAHNLGLEVTAEGVETAEQLSRLRALGCKYGQGYLFSKPVDGEEAKRMIVA